MRNMTTGVILIVMGLALLAFACVSALLATYARGQSTTIYDSKSGRVIGRTTTDTQGTTTLYGSDGRAVTRQDYPASGSSTVYDARTGKALSTIQREKR